MTIPLPEPVACQWLQHGQVVNAFNHPPGDRCRWDYDGYWAKKGYDKAPLFTADQLRAYGEAVRAEERERWEAAMKQAWSMIDPFNPAGVPGSYARGQDSGIVAALTTVRANYVAAAAIRSASPPQCTAPPSEPQ